MRFNSIRFKIGVLYVAILGTILILYSAILYLSLRYTLYNDLDNELRMKVAHINSTINTYLDLIGDKEESFLFALNRAIRLEGEHPDKHKIEEFEHHWLQKVDKFDLREHYISVSGIDGQLMIRSNNLSEDLWRVFEKNLKRGLVSGQILRTVTFNRNKIRVISIPFAYRNQQQYILQVGTPLKPIIRILENRLFYIAISLPIILFLAGFTGRLFAARILKPVVEITKTAENITHENLSARVTAEHIDVEMQYLVEAFNAMIIRLEDSFNYIVELSSHMSHELKTPLAIIRGEAELALRKDQDMAEYKRVMTITIQEVERMLRTINDLLLLTKLDYRYEVFKFEPIDLKLFFQEIFEQSKILASRKDIIVTLQMPQEEWRLNGDRLHLRRLFFNLIDNAIKFTPQNGRIDMHVHYEAKKVLVSIADTGVGIAREDLPEIFNRFFHIDRPDLNQESGCGLGLSIALSIAKIHKGHIRVESEVGRGTSFLVTLPLA